MCFSEKNGLKKSIFASKIAALVRPVSENGQWLIPKIISKFDRNAASVLRKQSTNCLERKKLEPQYSLNSQYFKKWTNANPMKIFRQPESHSKLLFGSKLSLG